jgi:simple sugar transport system permease protein/ribose transport system permease protein
MTTETLAKDSSFKSGLARITRFDEFGVLVVLVIMVVVFAFLIPDQLFIQSGNIMNIMRQITTVSIMAIGATFVIITAEIDLSPGSIFGFTGAIFATLSVGMKVDVTLSFIIAIAIAIGIGLLSGTFVTRVGVPAFIITLCMSMIFRGGVNIITQGHQLTVSRKTWLNFLFANRIGPLEIPSQIFFMVGLIILFAIILKITPLGFKTYATGGNRRAAEVSGINTNRIKLFAFALAAGLAGFAGIIGAQYKGSLYPTDGTGMEMDVVAACILGGTNLAGGRGTILGTLIGAAIIGIIRNALILLKVDAFYITATVGGVILIGVCVDTMVKRRHEGRLA